MYRYNDVTNLVAQSLQAKKDKGESLGIYSSTRGALLASFQCGACRCINTTLRYPSVCVYMCIFSYFASPTTFLL